MENMVIDDRLLFFGSLFISLSDTQFSCLIQVHRKSRKVTVIQRETNIGPLVTFNTVSSRRRRKEILISCRYTKSKDYCIYGFQINYCHVPVL